MRNFGHEKPLLAGEYNALLPNLYPEAVAAMQAALVHLRVSGTPLLLSAD
jgi:hypothetical protein